jgi:uncharacterized Fe-S center protein
MTKSRVYFLPWGERDRLNELLDAAGFASQIRRDDFTAIKIHFGERGGDGHVKPKEVRPIIKAVRKAKAHPFLTDTNTIYRGARSDGLSHLVVAAEHGYSQTKMGVPVVIADGLRGTSYREVEVGGDHFAKVKIASDIADADSIVAVSHVKGHLLCGFGGAIKNLGMGCGAKVGKYEMHAGTTPEVKLSACTKCGACIAICPQNAISFVKKEITVDKSICVGCGQCVAACDYGCMNIPWSQTPLAVQERLAEYATGAVKGRRLFCINFVNHVTPNCDCMGTKEKPVTDDVGILVSTDAVAVDRASLDLLEKSAGEDVFHKLRPDIDHTVQIVHAEKMGLGSQEYELVEV